MPAAWVTADEAYGGDQALRKDLLTRGIGYVLAVAKSHHLVLATTGDVHADTVVADLLPTRAWWRLPSTPTANPVTTLRSASSPA